MAAGLAVQDGTAVADGAGFCGEDVGGDALGLQKLRHLIRDGLMTGAGGQGLVDVGDVLHLGDGGDHQAVLVAHASSPALTHGAHARRAGPGLAVHGALMLADPADPVIELQVLGVDEKIAVQRQLLQLLFQKFHIHTNSSMMASQPSTMSFQVAVKSPVYQGSATSRSRKGRIFSGSAGSSRFSHRRLLLSM